MASRARRAFRVALRVGPSRAARACGGVPRAGRLHRAPERRSRNVSRARRERDGAALARAKADLGARRRMRARSPVAPSPAGRARGRQGRGPRRVAHRQLGARGVRHGARARSARRREAHLDAWVRRVHATDARSARFEARLRGVGGGARPGTGDPRARRVRRDAHRPGARPRGPRDRRRLPRRRGARRPRSRGARRVHGRTAGGRGVPEDGERSAHGARAPSHPAAAARPPRLDRARHEGGHARARGVRPAPPDRVAVVAPPVEDR
jgi:hypothetical protein